MNCAETREVADGVFAYLQEGGWGFSNAGLITGAGASLLVDTLYDVRLTARMLHELRRVAGAAARIDTVVNTHANGDHCWGNQLLDQATIISSRAAAEEMLELSPRLMHGLVQAARTVQGLGALAKGPLRLLGRLGLARASALVEAAPFLVESFGAFDFGEVALRAPDTTFDGQLDVRVGETEVQLIEVGPAHTRGDVIVYVPSRRVVFAGDMLFMGSHPIVWEGPVANWIAACDRLLALDVDVVVPGHGPITDLSGVAQTRAYWREIQQVAREAHAAGRSAEDAADQLLGRHDFREAERLIVNLLGVFRELGASTPTDPLALLARMARRSGRQRTPAAATPTPPPAATPEVSAAPPPPVRP